VATFRILQFENLYLDILAHDEDQIIRNKKFDVCFKWLLLCFGCCITVRLQVCGRNVFRKIFGFKKAEVNWQMIRTKWYCTYTPRILLGKRNAFC